MMLGLFQLLDVVTVLIAQAPIRMGRVRLQHMILKIPHRTLPLQNFREQAGKHHSAHPEQEQSTDWLVSQRHLRQQLQLVLI